MVLFLFKRRGIFEMVAWKTKKIALFTEVQFIILIISEIQLMFYF